MPEGTKYQATQTKTIIEVDEIILEKETVSKPVSACLKAPNGKQHQATQTKTIIEVDEIILEKDTVEPVVKN